MNEVNDFCIPDGVALRTEKFKDVSLIHCALNSQDAGSGEKTPPELAFVKKSVEAMSRLRFLAEQRYRGDSRLVKVKSKELPTNWFDVQKVLFTKDVDEPPQETITEIAETFFPQLQKLIQENLRKVLRRTRKMTALPLAQQLDSACMQWLSRQAGDNVYEKAGIRQEILSVTREESFDTLENRVLLSFLKECIYASNSYLRDYAKKPDGEEWGAQGKERLRKIEKLQVFCIRALRLPFFEKVRFLKALPTPNYVLQYNIHYSEVWKWFLRLIKRKQLIESVWPYRHWLCLELFHLSFEAFLIKRGFTPKTRNEPWINYFPSQGKFIPRFSACNLFVRDKISISIFLPSSDLSRQPVVFFSNGQNKIVFRLVFAYLPKTCGKTGPLNYRYEQDTLTIFFRESKEDKVHVGKSKGWCIWNFEEDDYQNIAKKVLIYMEASVHNA